MSIDDLLKFEPPLEKREELIQSLISNDKVIKCLPLKMKLFNKLCNYSLFERGLDLCEKPKKGVNLRTILLSLQERKFSEELMKGNEISFFSLVWISTFRNDLKLKLFEPVFDRFLGAEFRSVSFKDQIKLIKILKSSILNQAEGILTIQRRWKYIRQTIIYYLKFKDQRLCNLVKPLLEMELLPRNFISHLVDESLSFNRMDLLKLVVSEFKDQLNIFFNDSSIIFRLSIKGLVFISSFYSGEILGRIMRLRSIENLLEKRDYYKLIPLIRNGWTIKKKELIDSLKLEKSTLLREIFREMEESIVDDEIESFVSKYSKNFGTIRSYTYSTLIYISRKYSNLDISNLPYDISSLLSELEIDIDKIEVVEELLTIDNERSQIFFRLNSISKRSFIFNVKIVLLKLIDKNPEEMKFRLALERISPFLFDDVPILNPLIEIEDKKTEDPSSSVDGDEESVRSRRSVSLSIRIIEGDIEED